jgi:hypothetical protein
MELTTAYGDYQIVFDSHDKGYLAKNADGDVIRDGFTDLDKLTTSLDNLDKKKEKGAKKKTEKVSVIIASDRGYAKGVVATSIAPTGWRNALAVWVVDDGSRRKERAESILLDTPENRATLKKLQDAFNVEKASEKEREKIFKNLAHITPECFEV